ncbi:hypothetical protein ZD22_002588, partial [Salmonella enterica subsp. enterica]|nr:hypothetical protein [Salmonella enterica]EDS2914374.1 hypothetical protein [Salmonella enterica]EDV4373804.1 hypothetical protein [Salmonella enterica subsp. enterica]EGI6135210.1 hypothetical protein [Salmonella enterica subsp. enterica serovar Eastbourne]
MSNRYLFAQGILLPLTIMEKNMKIELITTKQFIEQAECYFRNYMDGLRR